MKDRLIQILPRLWPGHCGVTDHALRLADALRKYCGIETVFLVISFHERYSVDYEVRYIQQGETLATCDELTQGAGGHVLAHLSGYGYSPNGIPWALAEAFAQLSRSGRYGLACFFHELYAFSAPWKKAFWMNPLQKHSLRRIARMCDLIVSSTGGYVQWINGVRGRKPGVEARPLRMISTIGELEQKTNWLDRELSLVVLGLGFSRKRAYALLEGKGDAMRALGIERVIDIGPQFTPPATIEGLPVEVQGALSVEQLSKVLSSSRFGFVPHLAIQAAKSSIMASYASHGVLCVLPEYFEGVVDGLAMGKNVLSFDPNIEPNPESQQHIVEGVWQWYHEHDCRAHATTYRDWMQAK